LIEPHSGMDGEMKTVFITGTGRCGTTILRKILARHNQIVALPFESRFLIDPDGVVDLYESFSRSWSPFLADTRIKRFERLLKRLSKRTLMGMAGLALAKMINKNHVYFQPPAYARLNLGAYNENIMQHATAMKNEMGIDVFNGSWYGNVESGINPSINYCPPLKQADLAGILGRFVENVMGPVLAAAQAEYWCEDSPLSILSARSLLEILPQAKFVHIYRDPRDVTASYRKQSWAPGSTKTAVRFYKDVMRQINAAKKDLPPGTLYELSLEALLENQVLKLQEICSFLGLGDSVDGMNLGHGNCGRWQTEFSDDEKAFLQKELHEFL